MPGPTFGFVKLHGSSGSHCTKWADEQHRPAGFESRLVPDLPFPFISTLIGLRAFDLVSSPVWWEAATNKQWFQSTESSRWVKLRPAVVSTARIWSGMSRLWTYPSRRRQSPQTLTLHGGVRFIVWHLRHLFLGECWRGLRHFWSRRAHLRYAPASGPSLKRPRATLVRLVGCATTTVDLISWIQ